MTTLHNMLDRKAQILGYAGLLPPALSLLAVAADPTLRWIILAAGFGYAAVIFSFLGGVWWGMAMARPTVPAWIWIASVAPSLISLALFLPWTFGWDWPRPAMLILAVLILLSPLVELALISSGPLPRGWLRLRLHLSAGLSLLTILLARI